jgi:GNAT superfamily N-acetyltransferase
MRALAIRPARIEEAVPLSDFAWRSKAHWGYDAAFMARCRDALTVEPRHIAGGLCLVAEREVGVLGFIAVDPMAGDRAEIAQLFVEPDAIGRGVGRALVNAATRLLEQQGVPVLQTAADPHAEAFYHRAGFRTVGREPSESIPGRFLPTVRLELRPAIPDVGD